MFAKLSSARAALARVAAICAVAPSAKATQTTASAAAPDFDFSFTSAGSTNTVTGEIESLSDTANQPASAVILDSFPAALPLLATGLGALDLLGWRRKRKATAAS